MLLDGTVKKLSSIVMETVDKIAQCRGICRRSSCILLIKKGGDAFGREINKSFPNTKILKGV